MARVVSPMVAIYVTVKPHFKKKMRDSLWPVLGGRGMLPLRPDPACSDVLRRSGLIRPAPTCSDAVGRKWLKTMFIRAVCLCEGQLRATLSRAPRGAMRLRRLQQPSHQRPTQPTRALSACPLDGAVGRRLHAAAPCRRRTPSEHGGLPSRPSVLGTASTGGGLRGPEAT